ncbi:TIGR03885 family FMN-dependent LLM class oxidoreductase [Intrasporangium sp.]|uniref:TIGR03885 family FMN-dependent LLM class oxidoreductase n=1 Tax=Intrasporangium sp. TaxID=1925024 RepID=UPI0029399BF1|nr:TIGR03885 family FMN-dependent LLM class oxidoreductase [Intrasporangium sp.]MDV3220296.1 TIGR03885 family FMN-dependent LLM class oxidoreductase [Intrasporangium sp.]
MPTIGFHCSHEQIAPSQLLEDVKHAEAAGFTAAMCSDHLAPWSTDQGQSGYAWSWLGAALNATSLPFGVVTAPGQRYHPAITAQAIGTLGEMFPGRFWAALGSGEAVNEHVTGDGWPRKELRDRRLLECADVIRRLLEGEEVSYDGLITVDRAKVWSRPSTRPDLVAAAVSSGTAGRAAGWADGLITVNQQEGGDRKALEAYRAKGGRGQTRLQLHVSWAPSEDEALDIAMSQWRSNVFGSPVAWDTDSVEAFDELGRHVTEDDVKRAVHVSSDLESHAARIRQGLEDGFDAVMVHFVGTDQSAFIDAFGSEVLPQFADAPRGAGPLAGAAGGTTGRSTS